MRQSESEDILLKTEELLTPAGKDRKKRNDQSISGRHAINLNLLPLLSNPSWAGQDSTTHPRRKHSLTALPPKDIISSWSFFLSTSFNLLTSSQEPSPHLRSCASPIQKKRSGWEKGNYQGSRCRRRHPRGQPRSKVCPVLCAATLCIL